MTGPFPCKFCDVKRDVKAKEWRMAGQYMMVLMENARVVSVIRCEGWDGTGWDGMGWDSMAWI